MEGAKIAAGNFLFSFAILVAGASISKGQRVLRHMGVACISLSTFFRHQKASWSYIHRTTSFNPLSCIVPYFIILLCLTPDYFTHQGDSAGT
jgi:hypothetical protein